MPKEPKHKNKTINYNQQSLRKTHCIKNNYYYNQKPKLQNNPPENHWHLNITDPAWEYYTFLINQIYISALQFKETRDWRHWSYVQRHYQVLETLTNDSTNLVYLSLDQVKTLNEEIRKNSEATGKTNQTPPQEDQ